MEVQVNLKDIIGFFSEEIIEVYGNPDNIIIKNIAASGKADKNTLDWINPSKENKQEIAENSIAKAIVADKEIVFSQNIKEENKVLIITKNPKLFSAKVWNKFLKSKQKSEIHPTAVIHPDAALGKDIYIGSNASIGNCKIGNNVIIHSNVVIHDNVEIGNNVIIKSGAVLGSEGFGFVRDENSKLTKFPQIGRLIIHDNVEIGSNTCVDRGSLSDTIIGEGTKINNLCHIAHNVIIGKNVVITAHVNVSGSTIIEDNAWISPNVSLRGHQKIGKGAIIGMGAVVTKDVPPDETWIGNPAKKMEQK